MIKKFYIKNYNILILNIVFIFSIFFTNIILNPILIQDYNFKEHIISYSNMFLSIGLFTSTFIIRYILTFRFNYLKIINYGLLILISLSIIYIVLIILNKQYDSVYIQYTYVVLRIIEGMGTNMVLFVSSYIIGLKLINNDMKGTINGIVTSKIYLIKFIAPIIASYLILITGNNLSILMASICLYTVMYIYLIYNYKKIFLKNFKYILRKNVLIKKKLNLFKKKEIVTILFIKEIFKANKLNSIFLIIEIFIQNNYRSFYDIYLILIFTLVFKFTLMDSTFLYSLMIIGCALNFIVSYFYDKLYFKLKKYNEIYQTLLSSAFMLIMYVIFLYLYKNHKDIDNLYIFLMIFMFFFGLIRSIYSDRIYRIILLLSKKNGDLENYKSTHLIISEISNIFGYLMTGLILYYLSYIGILYYILTMSGILLITVLAKILFYKNGVLKN